MTTELAARRRGRAVALMLAAAALCGIAFVTLAIEARSARPDLAEGPVVPGLAQTIAAAQRISVLSSDASYRIEHTERGWVMRDRGDYPVQRGPLDRLTRGLEGLQYVRRMTSDAAQAERLGVGDPRHGGHGVLVQIEGARGGYLVNLILGVQPNGLYARRPDQNQVWAVRGDLPPLRNVASWLDLKPIDLDASHIARAEIAPATGGAYVLSRANAAASDFEITSPGHPTPGAPSVVTQTAEALTRLAPIDVQPAPAIQGAAKAHVRVVTFDGLAIEGELIDSDSKTWIKLVARPDGATPTPAQQQAALALNNRSAGWAYALSQQDIEALAPGLASLLPSQSVATTSPSALENRTLPPPN